MKRSTYLFVIFILTFPFATCKGRETSGLSAEAQEKKEILYWAFFNRGNDDLIPNRGRPAEPQRTTAAIEVEIYINDADDVVLDYVFYSPANEGVRREVEVGITNAFVLRQITGPVLAQVPQGALGALIQGDSAWQKRLVGLGREDNAQFYLGATPAQTANLISAFQTLDNTTHLQDMAKKFHRQGVTSLYGVKYESTTIAGQPPAGTLHFQARNSALQGSVNAASHIYYTRAYKARLVLMPASAILATPINGEIVAQSRSGGEVNLSSRPVLKPDIRPVSYGAIDRNALNQNRSTQGMRQRITWSISSQEVRVSMRDLLVQGRADPSQYLVKLATTSWAEQGELGTKLFESISPKATEGINDTTGDTDE